MKAPEPFRHHHHPPPDVLYSDTEQPVRRNDIVEFRFRDKNYRGYVVYGDSGFTQVETTKIGIIAVLTETLRYCGTVAVAS